MFCTPIHRTGETGERQRYGERERDKEMEIKECSMKEAEMHVDTSVCMNDWNELCV